MTMLVAGLMLLFFLAILFGVALGWWGNAGERPQREPTILFVRAVCGATIVEGELKMYKIPNTFNLGVSIQPVDALGQPAVVDGVPVWTVSDPAIADVQPAADGLSALIVPLVPASDGFQVSVSADADLGDGIRTLEGLLELSIGASEAVAIGISIGELVPKV